jgi:hypothetical protein
MACFDQLSMNGNNTGVLKSLLFALSSEGEKQ